MLELQWGAQTDVGRVRPRNEDAYLAQEPVFLVADGMGGHVGGAAASSVVVAAFEELLGGGPGSPAEVAGAIARANEEILRRVSENDELVGMGTTLVGIVLVEEGGEPFWLAFNIGDSRLYRYIDGELTRLSVDHSVVQELLESGEITQEQVAGHRERNVVTRALGSDPGPEADFWMLAPHDGERFLLCSDGLTGEVPEARIAQILGDSEDPHITASRLITEALEGGGRDNVTAVVVQVGTPEEREPGWMTADTIERPVPSLLPETEG